MTVARNQLEGAGCIHDCGDTLADDRFILRVQQEAKLIGKAMIVNFICTQRTRENIGYTAQQTVTDRKAEGGVDKLKAVQVEQDQRIDFIFTQTRGSELHNLWVLYAPVMSS